MRSVLIAVATLIVCSAPASAQTTPAQGVSLLGGITSTNLVPRIPAELAEGGLIGSESKVGVIGGISFDKPVNDKVKIVIQALYHQVQSTLVGFDDGDVGVLKARLAYLNIPVLLGFTPHERVTVLAGLDLGLKLTHKETALDFDDELLEIPAESHRISGGFTTGIAFGAQIHLDKVFLEILYKVGLTNLWSRDFFEELSGSSVLPPGFTLKARSISFMVGFRLGGR